MGPLVVVELDPVADHATGVLLDFKAVTVDALLRRWPIAFSDVLTAHGQNREIDQQF